jgi:hypothetical protein
MPPENAELLDLDTVVAVDSSGYDEEFTRKTHPNMVGYIVPGTKPGTAIYHIEIPITWVPVQGV